MKFDFKMESAKCTMSVSDHYRVTVRCDNKKDGKQSVKSVAVFIEGSTSVYSEVGVHWFVCMVITSNYNNINQLQFGSNLVLNDR